jgi:histidyl-tRNA synthetase
MLFMLGHFLGELGIADLHFELNSLGCPECRPIYLSALNDYFKGFDAGQLCEDCMRRKLTNPLRVLDCKVPSCRELTRTAPLIADYQCPGCREHFDAVLALLDAGGLNYTLSPRLVRGLDYYTRTTFEVTSGRIGAQTAVAGGGRYDGLVKSLGGPDLPGMGFACGMERLAMLMGEVPPVAPDFFLAALGDKALNAGLLLSQELRNAGLAGECALAAKSAKSQMRQAGKSGARFCLILGDSEVETGTVVLKDMASGSQDTVSRASLLEHFRK